jgi:SNF2 family DNA or RNA helicase
MSSPELLNRLESATPLSTLIDNRPGNRMADAVRRLMCEAKTVDIATGYFEVGSLLELDGAWQRPQHIRLLMGGETMRKSKQLFAQELRNARENGIERAKEENDWQAIEGLRAVKAAIQQGAIEAKVYTKAKFHAKAMHFQTGGIVNHGLIGSSNFTYPGLTQNLELNLFTSDNSQLEDLLAWYEAVWAEAEDIEEEILDIISPHIADYTPFQIYLKAMRERFYGLEPDESGWEQNVSKVYPLLAKYQQDAYHDLTHMAKIWGGGMLCDGVGLGKTYVALMLIERALHDRQRVLVVAPKATIPSVWDKNLSRLFPDDYDPDPDYQHDIRVIPHTDFGRHGGLSMERIEWLRQRYDTIIVDEAHHFRVPSRNRSKKLKALTKDRRLFLLTATPVNNSLLDLYNLLNFVSQDRDRHFETVNVPRLRNWFATMMNQYELQQFELDFARTPTLQEFLKHVIVQRSRRYVKQLEQQEHETVKFPIRENPEVINYNLSQVYGPLLPKLLKAFDSQNAQLKLVIYETEKYKEERQRDTTVLNEQSQVVGLIRTMLLKRLESSQRALEASIEDLLLKHITLIKDLQPIEHEAWLAENREVFDVLQRHRHERSGTEISDEEEDELPLTTYEAKKIEQVKADLTMFGRNEPEWWRGLRGDIRVLTEILRGLHAVTRPENDAKLLAFLECIRRSPRLQKDKFVVFSEFKDTARYLEEQLKLHFPKEKIVEVDSGRNVKNREQVIKRFAPHYNCDSPQECAEALRDPIRILISTDVLSEGLNLQDANIIVNYDLHWNPVRLMQRIGRVDRRMDSAKPVQYEKVYVYNFLPPDDLENVLHLYGRITGKLIAINRSLGIEAPVVEANDDFKAKDFYQNLGQSEMTVAEQLRLKAHELEKLYPNEWSAAATYPNRIYSGKPLPPHGGDVTAVTEVDQGGSYIFLAYRVPTGMEQDVPDPQPTYDTKWYLFDRASGEITEDLQTVHALIDSLPATPREIKSATEDRDLVRKLVEDKEIAKIQFRSNTGHLPYELICWMEIG